MRRLKLPPSSVRDIATLPANRSATLSVVEAISLFQRADPSYRAQIARLANFNHRAAFIEVILPKGQSGAEGLALVRKVREIAASPPFRESAFGFEVSGEIPEVLDSVQVPDYLLLTTYYLLLTTDCLLLSTYY